MEILVVDDEKDICELVSGILTDEHYDVRAVTNGVEALEAIRLRQPSLVLLDVWLGDGARDGLKILETVKKDHPYVPVVMMSGHGTVETAVSAIKLGAYDFIEKPFQVDRLLLVVKRAIESASLKRENAELKVHVPDLCSLIGGHPKVLEIKQEIETLSQTNNRVCLYGPLGSDRSAIARMIHTLSSRGKQPFCSVNVLSIGSQNIGTELFGLETVIEEENTPRKIGLLESSHGGTLFIDEVGALPPSVQTKLNFFFEHGTFTRVGGHHSISVNVRCILGSSIGHDDLLNNEQFSKDLFYRMNTSYIEIPSLAERTRDLALLSRQYIASIATSQRIPAKPLSSTALALLENYPWPGDIQQLKNVLEWSLIMSFNNGTECIEIDDLPPDILQGNEFARSWHHKSAELASLPMKEARETFERSYLEAQLRRFHGNVTQTAKFVGMDRTALHRKLKLLGLAISDEAMGT